MFDAWALRSKVMFFLAGIFAASACKDIKNGYRISKMFCFFFVNLVCEVLKIYSKKFFETFFDFSCVYKKDAVPLQSKNETALSSSG